MTVSTIEVAMLLQQMEQVGITRDQLNRLAHSPSLMRDVKRLIEGDIKETQTSEAAE